MTVVLFPEGLGGFETEAYVFAGISMGVRAG